MVHGHNYDVKTDNWAIGVLTYEFLVGKAPFETSSKVQTLNSIKKGEVKFPNFVSAEARDFVNKLLVLDPTGRMSLDEAMAHVFITKHEK
jgi:aurora kinase